MSTAPIPPQFTAILSTAGSRKTTQLTERAVAHVLAGHAKPDEILLTTLTRSAAAQLHERTVEQLLNHTRGAGACSKHFLDLCHRLEHAAIGTLHSLGLNAAARHAFATGRSPAIRVLSAGANRRMLLESLAEIDDSIRNSLMESGRRLGRLDPGLRRFDGAAWIDDLLSVIGVLRRLGVTDLACGPDPFASHDALVTSLGTSTSVTDDLASLLKDVEARASEYDTPPNERPVPEKILSRGFWGALTQVKHGRPHSHWFRELHKAPAFHADCRAYIESLLNVSREIVASYTRAKRVAGLLDFHDLADAMHDFGWADALALIGCDEVQDLSPREVESVERLFDSSPRPDKCMVWVGDHQQHLFAYQGSSWSTVDKTLTKRGATRYTADTNYRATELLVNLFNQLFPTPRWSKQESGRKSLETGEVTHVERWTLRTSRPAVAPESPLRHPAIQHALHYHPEAEAVAVGISDLLKRRGPAIRPADVAVVVRTNFYANAVIEALHGLGVPVDASPRSMAATREGRAVIEALRFLADPDDALAEATLCHLLQTWTAQPGPQRWFWDRLRGVKPEAEKTAALRDLSMDRSTVSRLSPVEAVQRVISALALVERSIAWGDSAGRSRNLDGLVSLARAYEGRCAAERRAPTIAGLAASLDAPDDDDDSNRPTRVATGGVTVTTTHSAKGLGWPVVVVAECSWETHDDRSTFTIREFEAVDPTTSALEQRLHVLPWSFGSYPWETPDGRWIRLPYAPWKPTTASERSAPHYRAKADSLPGSRAIAKSDQEAEENNIFVAFTRAKSILVIAAGADAPRLSFLKRLDRLLPPSIPVNAPRTITGVSMAAGDLDYTRFAYAPIATTPAAPPPAAVVSAVSVADKIAAFRRVQHSDLYLLEYPPTEGTLPSPDGDYPRRYWKPSDEPPAHTRGINPAAYYPTDLGTKPLPARAAARITRANDFLVGDVIHALFAALPSLADLAPGDREDAIERIAAHCIAAGGDELPLDARDLRDRVLAFEQWLATEGLDLITELPLVVERTAMPNTFWRGRIDALGVPRSLSSSGGGTRIIDHKSATGFTPEWLAAWLAETGAYSATLIHGSQFDRLSVHLPFQGTVLSK